MLEPNRMPNDTDKRKTTDSGVIDKREEEVFLSRLPPDQEILSSSSLHPPDDDSTVIERSNADKIPHSRQVNNAIARKSDTIPHTSKDQQQQQQQTFSGKIFVGALSWDTTEASLHSYFSRFGTLQDVKIMNNLSTGQPRGFGFVTFADPSVLERVFQQVHIVDSKQVDVKQALSRSLLAPTKNEDNKVFVGGIHHSIKEQALADHFRQFGEIKDAVIMVDHTSGKSRGFGFVTFEDHAGVENALCAQHLLGNKQVEVTKAQARSDNKSFLVPQESSPRGAQRSDVGTDGNATVLSLPNKQTQLHKVDGDQKHSNDGDLQTAVRFKKKSPTQSNKPHAAAQDLSKAPKFTSLHHSMPHGPATYKNAPSPPYLSSPAVGNSPTQISSEPSMSPRWSTYPVAANASVSFASSRHQSHHPHAEFFRHQQQTQQHLQHQKLPHAHQQIHYLPLHHGHSYEVSPLPLPAQIHQHDAERDSMIGNVGQSAYANTISEYNEEIGYHNVNQHYEPVYVGPGEWPIRPVSVAYIPSLAHNGELVGGRGRSPATESKESSAQDTSIRVVPVYPYAPPGVAYYEHVNHAGTFPLSDGDPQFYYMGEGTHTLNLHHSAST